LPADEDLLCAEYIRDRIHNKKTHISNAIIKLKNGSGKRFFNPANQAHSPPNDFTLCTQIGIFNFLLKAAEIRDDAVVLQKQEV
jgi:2-phosphosulfolactate phosphatase